MNIKNTSFFAFALSSISTLMLPGQATAREDFINWKDYLRHCSDYRKHQEPIHIATHGCKWGRWVSFANKIEAIEARVGSWKEPEELFQSQDFVAMYKHPCYYWKSVAAYLGNRKPSEQQKQIAIYSLEQLGTAHYLSFAEECYKLYKKKLLSETLFQLVLGFELLRIHPLVTAYQGKEIKSFLMKLQSDPTIAAPIGCQVTKILTGALMQEWDKKALSAYYNYRYPTPIPEIIRNANKEQKQCVPDFYGGNLPHPNYLPDFLMILDYPDYYYDFDIEGSKGDAVGFISDATYSEEEKRLVIFAMHQLSSEAYASFLQSVCKAYHWGRVSVSLMEDLLHCSRGYSARFKYPFFILDYAEAHVQSALNEFMALPTLPCGLKEMARKIKAGKLATAEEMAYMKGYKKFREAHFPLYETIPPRNQ